MRVLIADDSGIFRRGLRLLLEAAGCDVLDDVPDVPSLMRLLGRLSPDVCILDVRLPPTFGDEGVLAAEEIRRRWPRIGLLLLSTYGDTGWARRLLSTRRGGVGYLLKDRVNDAAELMSALRRIADGGTALDPDVVAALVHRTQVDGRLDLLTGREREALALMAQGMSNAGIGRALSVAPKTVEAYVAAVFVKLQLGGEYADPNQNRRVLAVLAYLENPR